ncbi:MAG: DUF1571 domain-containing protein [Planctomycetes bacterium]|nr:DUF1571 domain-containing protein [Planctomycetota bacterium]
MLVLIFFLPATGSKTNNLTVRPESPTPLNPQQKKAHRGPFGSDPKIVIDPARVVKLAQTDHIALINLALNTYQKRVRDYTATFYKQERIKGKLKKTELINVMFREKPFSLFMKWEKNAGKIDKLLYVEGQNNNQMLVHPTGLFSGLKSVKRDPCDKEVKSTCLCTCDEFGFYRSMKNLLSEYQTAQKNGDLKIKYLGEKKIQGHRCLILERTLPNKKQYPNARLIMEFDVECLLPVTLTCYDWKGKLIAKYSFKDLKFNVGLTSNKFHPNTHDM